MASPPPPMADAGSSYQGYFPGVGREGEGDGCSGRQSTRWLSRMTHITCNVLPIEIRPTSEILPVELGTWALLQRGAQPLNASRFGGVSIATMNSC